MGNKEYADLRQLRRDVVALILQGQYKFSAHAEKEHQEVPPQAKGLAILRGENDQPNRSGKPGKPSYVCWYRHPRFGLLRGVYAIVEPPEGGEVLVITVFRE